MVSDDTQEMKDINRFAGMEEYWKQIKTSPVLC